MRVLEMDHIVLNVADVERAVRFYCDELGLAAERVDEWDYAHVRMNDFLDHYLRPETGAPAPAFDVTAAIEIPFLILSEAIIMLVRR